MSGIAVIHNLDGKPAQPQLLTRMLDAIAHRAVDGRDRLDHLRAIIDAGVDWEAVMRAALRHA